MVLETASDPFPEEYEPLQALDVNQTGHSGHDELLDVDEDMVDLAPGLSSPISSLSFSRSSTPSVVRIRHGRTTASSSPHIRRERTTPPPSSPPARHEHTTPPPHIQRERTTSPSSSHVRRAGTAQSSRRATPSSPRLESNKDLLPQPHKRARPPPAPFRQGYTPGPKPKAADYEDGVEKMLLNAMHEYACLILSTEAFPNEVKQTQWAKATWQAACDEVGMHYECSVRMIRLVRLLVLLSSHRAEY